jgi:hypothetical protein
MTRHDVKDCIDLVSYMAREARLEYVGVDVHAIAVWCVGCELRQYGVERACIVGVEAKMLKCGVISAD